MDRNSLRTLQMVEMKLLREVDSICRSLNIKYYLIGGTLLGAVRHGGFIPWDVDIDIAMLRNDYEIFRKYCIERDDEEFFFEDYSTEKNHSECHAILKIRNTEIRWASRNKDRYPVTNKGIYLDIFPLDYAPNDCKKQKIQQIKIKFLSSLLQAKVCRDYGSGKGIYYVKKLLGFVLRPVSFSTIQKIVDKEMQKYNNGECEYIVSMASHYSYYKQLMPFDYYGTPVKIQFEDGLFYAPAKPHEYLKKLFGDYMQLPPEETRYEILNALEYVDYGKCNLPEEHHDQ